jgi:hypothetical protein
MSCMLFTYRTAYRRGSAAIYMTTRERPKSLWGLNIRSAIAAGGQCPRGTVARPICVCCQCVSCSGISQAVMGSFSVRVYALAVVLTYPRPFGWSQRLKQRPTLLLSTTTTLIGCVFIQRAPAPARPKRRAKGAGHGSAAACTCAGPWMRSSQLQ